MRERAERWVLGAIVVAAIVVRAAARPVAPDGWDGVGFVQSIESFDLAAFRPHPPGYPLFVAAARLVHLFGAPPLASVTIVSLLAGAMLPVAGWWLVRRAFDAPRAALYAATILALAPGFVTAGAATLSDGAATTLILATYAAALGDRPTAPLVTGLLAAATIGVRPIAIIEVVPALVLFFVRRPVRASIALCASTMLGVATWAVPTAVAIGAARWWSLSRAQLEGHLDLWARHDRQSPLFSSMESIAMQLFGAEGTIAVVAVSIVVAFAIVVAVVKRRKQAIAFVALVVPSAIAVAALQPMHASPRHALPFTAAVVLLFTLPLDSLSPSPSLSPASSPPRLSLSLSNALPLTIALPLALPCARALTSHRSPPSAVAMLRFVASDASMKDAAIVAGRSSRFAAWVDGVRIVPGQTAGDAIVWATTFADPFPRPLLVTDEIDLRGVPESRLELVASFDRWSPIDRRERTLRLFRLAPPPPCPLCDP